MPAVAAAPPETVKSVRAAARSSSTAQILAQALRQAGVRYAFGIPGGEVLELLEALRRCGIHFVLTKHELSAGFMAEASYALAGAPGLLVATLGPGCTNAVTPIAQALLDRSALIAVTGEIASALGTAFTHQVLDQQGLLRPVVKWSAVLGARGAAELVRKGIAIATEPMPGPVHFRLPADVAAMRQPFAAAAPVARVLAVPRAAQLGPVRRWLERARRPLAFAGLAVGVERAEPALARFLERWRVPLVTTYKAKGALPEDHALAIGAAGLSPVVDAIHRKELSRADLVLTIGFDPVELRSEWIAPWLPTMRSVNIDLVPNRHGLYASRIECIGPIAATLDALAACAPARAPRRWSARDLAAYRGAVRAAVARRRARRLGPFEVATALRRVFPRETIATVDTGSHRILVNHVWEAYGPRQLLQSNGLGSMGYALPTAVAAKLLFPRRPVLAMTGEAGLDMVIGELVLLAHHRLPVTVVVFRDDVLSLIRLKQERMGLPATGVVTGNADYAAIAAACGGTGVAVDNAADLERAAQAALRAPRFTLIEARIDPAEYRSQM